MRFSFLLFCLIIGFTAGYGQVNFQPGYIVKKNGDTVRCEIDYRNWLFNPDKITVDAELKKEYGPGDLSSFAVGNDIYRAYTVSYYLGAIEPGSAPQFFTNERETRTVFLRLLSEGNLALYKLHEKKREYFFVAAQNGKPMEMVYRVKLSGGVLGKDEQYKDDLRRMIRSEQAKKAGSLIDRMDYEHQDFIKLFTLLNGSQAAEGKDKIPGRADVRAGIFYYGYTYNKANLTFRSQPGFSIGGGFTLSSPRSFHRIQSRLGIDISSMAAKWTEKTGVNTTVNKSGTMTYLQPSASLEYIFNPLSATKSEIGGELSYNFSIGKQQVFGGYLNGGFVGIRAFYAIAGKFGKFYILGGTTSNILHPQLPRETTLVSKHMGLAYAYQF